MKQIDERAEPLVVYRDGDRVWREEFPVIIAEDGELLLSTETALQLERRMKHFLKLADRGELPEPSGMAPEDEDGDGVTWNLDEPVLRPLIVYHEGERYWMEDFPVYLASDGDFLPSEATMDQWEERHRHYRELAERGELPEPSKTLPADSHEAAGA